MFPYINTLNVDLILELFWAFLDQTELFLRLGHGSKPFLGSTHTDKQLSFSKFCSISPPSYLSGWVSGLVVGLL